VGGNRVHTATLLEFTICFIRAGSFGPSAAPAPATWHCRCADGSAQPDLPPASRPSPHPAVTCACAPRSRGRRASRRSALLRKHAQSGCARHTQHRELPQMTPLLTLAAVATLRFRSAHANFNIASSPSQPQLCNFNIEVRPRQLELPGPPGARRAWGRAQGLHGANLQGPGKFNFNFNIDINFNFNNRISVMSFCDEPTGFTVRASRDRASRA
jgi:hypothetical protein